MIKKYKKSVIKKKLIKLIDKNKKNIYIFAAGDLFSGFVPFSSFAPFSSISPVSPFASISLISSFVFGLGRQIISIGRGILGNICPARSISGLASIK
jgi:hypothetical protein